MLLDRRTAIKRFMIIAGGLVLVPSCMTEDDESSASFTHFTIGHDEEKMMSELCGTIIPATDTPGAKEINAHLFVLKMVDDCYGKEDQDRFMSGMKQFEKLAGKRFDSSFERCTDKEKAALLNAVEKKEGIGEDIYFFYSATKALTIQGYTTSEYYLTKINEYQLVPGYFNGCAPVKQAGKSAGA